ncbi:unnamed protein product [Microthlaspi erraticum]|uniref:Serpin domain-containing protein n=1 Tax=Microthlaspi erraticum TaxID=1685480 RepID=A0A6D2KKQ2_9BRAS|nr:unnamed protein product [Microthlaspi erraticum]
MISSYRKTHYVEAYDDFKVLKLPFRQGRDKNRSFSMHFYLPDEKHGLDNLVKKMTSAPGFLDNHIPSETLSVGLVSIPKFKISFGFEASKEFDLGFDKVDMYHKACVEIDEEGAEAAAVTFLCVPTSFIRYSTDFVADHPFLFLIREDKTETVLFAGQVFDPSKSS